MTSGPSSKVANWTAIRMALPLLSQLLSHSVRPGRRSRLSDIRIKPVSMEYDCFRLQFRNVSHIEQIF